MKTNNKQKTVVQQQVIDTSALNVKHTQPDDASKNTVKTTTKTPIDKKPLPTRLDPTRYGDWEKNGRCIDF